MRFSQVLSAAIAAGVATAEPLANVLAANNNTLSTLNCKTWILINQTRSGANMADP